MVAKVNAINAAFWLSGLMAKASGLEYSLPFSLYEESIFVVERFLGKHFVVGEDSRAKGDRQDKKCR